MTPRPSRLPPDEQIAEIIDAAASYLSETSFEQFRLVELAKTLGMSHSNIYRFFKSKEDLFDAVVDRWLEESRLLIGKTLELDLEAFDKLVAMLLAIHQSSRDKLSNDPSGFELYQHMWSSRAEAAEKHRKFIVSHGIALIKRAIEEESLVSLDPVKAALLIQAATTKFMTPVFVKESLHEDTSTQLQVVLRALIFYFRSQPDSLSES
ncbi:MAG: TetR/AcrR family transcriptional regulator [Pseudomonadota bacterium]